MTPFETMVGHLLVQGSTWQSEFVHHGLNVALMLSQAGFENAAFEIMGEFCQ